ncbi:MAG: protein-tyrosine phosphatase [Solirubrobacteraceae bacterium]|nr:protein-tyrosine phosphatase [Solirubrobacteraceae bacterium]
MIDLHCHVLPGIDDGPSTIDESVALVREAAAVGTRTLVATPHVSRRFGNDASIIERATQELNARLLEEEIAVEVRAGAEIALGRAGELDDDALPSLSLGGGPWLLVEPPFSASASGLDILLLDLQRRGHRLLLAHPERCPAFRRDRHALRRVVSEGALTSLTAGSLSGAFGGDVRRFAFELVSEGLVHNVASDFHDLRGRPPGIADALAHSELGAFADWWTLQVPSAILAGSEIPSRPRVSPPVAPPRRQHAGWRRLARLARAS